MHTAVRDMLLARQRSIKGWIDMRELAIEQNQAAIATARTEIEGWEAELASIEALLDAQVPGEASVVTLTSDTPITVTRSD